MKRLSNLVFHLVLGSLILASLILGYHRANAQTSSRPPMPGQSQQPFSGASGSPQQSAPAMPVPDSVVDQARDQNEGYFSAMSRAARSSKPSISAMMAGFPSSHAGSDVWLYVQAAMAMTPHWSSMASLVRSIRSICGPRVSIRSMCPILLSASKDRCRSMRIRQSPALPSAAIDTAIAGLSETNPGTPDGDFVAQSPFDPNALRGWGEYDLWGDETLRPETVFRDDHFTYIRFGKRWKDVELPTAYVVVDGIDELVNTRVQGETYIIESTRPLITLKSGQSYLCIEYTGDAA